MNMARALMFCYLLTRLHRTGSNNPDILDICRHQNLCQRNASRILSPGYKSCCQDCSCNNSCYQFGNCCQDISPGVSNVVLPCQQFLKWDAQGRVAYKRPYRVMDTCPANTIADEETILACKHNTSLEDFLSVSGKDGFRMYKNKHCALCNHEMDDVVEWTIASECNANKLITSFKTFADRDIFLMSECRNFLLPPSPFYSDKTACLSSEFDVFTCNQSGLWDLSDPIIERGCSLEVEDLDVYNTIYTMSSSVYNKYHGQAIGLGRTYANYYCYLCNIPHSEHSATVDICPADLNAYSSEFNRVFGSLKVLLDMHPPQYSFLQETRMCSYAQIYDPAFKTCRNVYCNPWNIYTGKTCIPYGRIIGLTINVMFELLDVYYIDLNTSILSTVRDKLRHEMLAYDCTFCSLQLLESNGSDTMFVDVKISTSFTCTIDYLLNFFKDRRYILLYSYAEGVIGNDTELSLTFTRSEERIPLKSLVINKTRTCHKYNDMREEWLNSCPRIVFNVRQLYLSGRFSSHTADSVFSNRIPGSATTQNVLICVSDYLAIVNTGTRIHVYRMEVVTAMFVCVMRNAF